jgi:hypothetical protein
MEFVKYIPGILLVLIICVIIIWRWIEGIDFMSKNHPNYKGNDLFKLDEDDINQIG